MEAQIKKGILEMCVLFAIKEKEMYGYDVMRYMKQFFPEVNESTFYAILRRLHAEGSAEIITGGGTNSGGPVRKYYKITPDGENTLAAGIESWRHIRGAVNKIGIM